MGKAEKFSLFAGIVGLTADILALGVFVTSWIDRDRYSSLAAPISFSFLAAVTGAIIYSWLLGSWFLARRSYLHFCEQNRNVQWRHWQSLRFAHSKTFLQYVIGAVFGVAILVSPFAFLLLKLWFSDADLDSSSIVLATIILEGVIGFTISMAIIFLMPVIYSDVEADLFTMLALLNPFRRR